MLLHGILQSHPYKIVVKETYLTTKQRQNLKSILNPEWPSNKIRHRRPSPHSTHKNAHELRPSSALHHSHALNADHSISSDQASWAAQTRSHNRIEVTWYLY